MRLDVAVNGDLAATVGIQKAAIDEAAGKARARYITSVPGQAETYLRKSDNAQAYLNAGSPADLTGYEWVAADAEAFGLTPEQAAQVIVDQEAAWKSLGMTIEKIRLGYKHRIDGASTTATVNQLAREAITILDQL